MFRKVSHFNFNIFLLEMALQLIFWWHGRFIVNWDEYFTNPALVFDAFVLVIIQFWAN
jgi:hypothetical protein